MTPGSELEALREALEAEDSLLFLEAELRYFIEETGGLRYSSPLGVVKAHFATIRAALSRTTTAEPTRDGWHEYEGGPPVCQICGRGPKHHTAGPTETNP